MLTSIISNSYFSQCRVSIQPWPAPPLAYTVSVINAVMQTTHAVLCIGQWSALKLVKDEDVNSITEMKDEEGDEKEMDDSWDVITLAK